MNNQKSTSIFSKFLNTVERVGNKLPHPISLFSLLALIIIFASYICESFGVAATGELLDRTTNEITLTTITAKSLISRDGLVFIFTNAVSNFTSFAPLGTVLVSMLGVGVAEHSGFISALLKSTVKITPKQIITPVVVFLGIMSNIASDAGYVVLIPVGAMMFSAYGRHPLAGLAAAFAGVSGGFSANLIIGTLDPMLAGITNEATALIDSTYTIQPTANWYFLFVSTFLITAIGWVVTDFVVEPRLGVITAKISGDNSISDDISVREKKALKFAGISLLAILALLLAVLLPENSFFRNAKTGSIITDSPFMGSIIVIIALFFFLPAVTYGFVSGKYNGEKDVCAALGTSMSAMGGYIALAFFASQFIQYFAYTNLGSILALQGAAFFKSSGIGAIPLMLLFVIFCAFLNLFMGSASAKWTILAPVFVPMFMLLGYSPELTQVAFRIGDSCTNIISPLMSYFAMILVFAKKYDKDAGMGTLISTMLPYSLSFLASWFLLLVTWILLELPLGPGAQIFLG